MKILLALAMLLSAAAASAGEHGATIEYVIYVYCQQAGSVLSCHVDDQGTKADISRTVQKQIRCILAHTPLADDLRAARVPPREQWVRMVVSLSAIELLTPGWRVPQIGAFEIDGRNPSGCSSANLNIGTDYKTDSMHALSAYVRQAELTPDRAASE